MNTKALITALAIVVGSSSVAMARPATVSVSGSVRGSISFGSSSNYDHYDAGYQRDIRDHRMPVRTIRQPVAPLRTWGWNREPVIMDQNLQFTTPNPDGEMPYNDARWETVGTFGTGFNGTAALVYSREKVHAIQISAMSGRPAFTDVLITYQDGTRETVHVNAYVDRTGMTIVTKPAPIRQVQFLSPSNVRGTFSFSIGHAL